MTLLVINSGSSSLKVAVFNHLTLERLIDVRVNEIGTKKAALQVNQHVSQVSTQNHATALLLIIDTLKDNLYSLKEFVAVGHRILHGGELLVQPTIINDEEEKIIASMNELAPLHNPACLAGVRAARKILPHCPHIAVFDTEFHATLPTRARLYALPNDVTQNHQLRRFGFHGISHQYVSGMAAEALRTDIKNLRIISCHLGNGCSVTAVENGRSVETSMGMTPLEGLVMGTRSGDLDPGIIIRLMHDSDMSAEEIDTLLNQHSGLVGMTGTNNMSDIEQRAAQGDEDCRRAIQIFSHRTRKYIGAYAAVMGGVDAIVFTGGIGENSPLIRHRIAQRFDFLNASLDEDRNRDACVNTENPIVDVSRDTSLVKILVIATDEETAIAKSITQKLKASTPAHDSRQITVAVSARHVHLNQETIQSLFGPGYTLTQDAPLSQPGQFSAHETVTVIGPRNQLEGVRVLGPPRAKNQLEISRSDEFFLGVDAPVRASGDTDNTPGITLRGPTGTVTLKNGVICAQRHIHMHPKDANHYSLEDGDLVDVVVDGGIRDLTFRDVLVRVSENFKLEMHIDTDEANAAELQAHDTVTLAPTTHHARITRTE